MYCFLLLWTVCLQCMYIMIQRSFYPIFKPFFFFFLRLRKTGYVSVTSHTRVPNRLKINNVPLCYTRVLNQMTTNFISLYIFNISSLMKQKKAVITARLSKLTILLGSTKPERGSTPRSIAELCESILVIKQVAERYSTSQ